MKEKLEVKLEIRAILNFTITRDFSPIEVEVLVDLGMEEPEILNVEDSDGFSYDLELDEVEEIMEALDEYLRKGVVSGV